MSAAKVGFIVFCLALMIVFGVWILGAMADDNVWKFQELVGVGLLSFVFVFSIGTVAGIAAADAICKIMEFNGDRCRAAGDMKGACAWYGKALWLQDILLSNVYRRAQLMGKLVNSSGERRAADNGSKNDNPANGAGNGSRTVNGTTVAEPIAETEISAGRPAGFVVPPAVANSLFYKYGFAIIFATIAVVYAMGGKAVGAIVILIVGIVLNAYWLSTADKD